VFQCVGPSLLESFLSHTHALTHLRINFQKHDQESAEYVLERFSLAQNLLPSLERFELGMARTTPDLLLQVVSRFAPKLRHIGLWKFELSHSVLLRWSDSKGRFNPWPRFLKDLSRVASLKLESMALGCITQSDHLRTPFRINFASGKVSQEGTGDMEVFLSELIDNLRVEWPAPPQSDQEHEEDGDEDEDMDDDDE
jgi:hypothetical protein